MAGAETSPLNDERLAANRAAWDARVPVHAASRSYDVEGRLRDKQGPHPWELEALGDVSGLRLVHLQCHLGLDTLAWARAGASVVGLDFSPTAIETAQSLAGQAGLSDRAQFVCADVYDAPAALHGGTFDVVYVSTGALCWLPSVDRWAAVVAALVAPGGRFYLHDGHPMAWALADERLTVEHTYFEEDDPFVDDSTGTYADAPGPLPRQPMYEWNHGLGETVTALIRHGLQLVWLKEHDWAVWPRFPWLIHTGDGRWVPSPGTPRIPLQFELLATRSL
ncbi:MAG: class I SAM-dependent methyltransferase [Candidatus Dormibacteraeota bacterium]|nr:class I SAM-dependent methyltransferase [Candidatus Dormibacteraeota bacterium]